jgi:uncharacterized protein YndB with AHSA1/START domain
MSVVELAPVVKTVEVKRSAADAFRIYVHEASKWWPLESHALSPENGTRAVEHVVEPRVGGRIYEVSGDGRQFDWGEVLVYEPGRRFAMTWQLGRPRAQSGDVDVIFEATAVDTCRVTLTHSGWERMGEHASQMRQGYNNGWETIMKHRFADYANTEGDQS